MFHVSILLLGKEQCYLPGSVRTRTLAHENHSFALAVAEETIDRTGELNFTHISCFASILPLIRLRRFFTA